MKIPRFERILRYFQDQPISKAWIFGSFSRGEETPESDIDLMITFIPGLKSWII